MKYKCLAKHAFNNLMVMFSTILIVPFIIQDNISLAILVAITALIGAVDNTFTATNLELNLLNHNNSQQNKER